MPPQVPLHHLKRPLHPLLDPSTPAQVEAWAGGAGGAGGAGAAGDATGGAGGAGGADGKGAGAANRFPAVDTKMLSSVTLKKRGVRAGKRGVRGGGRRSSAETRRRRHINRLLAGPAGAVHLPSR